MSSVRETVVRVPFIMDKARMLRAAQTRDPMKVVALDLSKQRLHLVVIEDLQLFQGLIRLSLAENSLPIARFGCLTKLRFLNFASNGVKSLDLEVEGKFIKLESLDLSCNRCDASAQIGISTFEKLLSLDLSFNNLRKLSPLWLDNTKWQENVLRLILPNTTNLEYHEITGTTFRGGFVALKRLDLSHNPLDSSCYGILKYLPNLRFLLMNFTLVSTMQEFMPDQSYQSNDERQQSLPKYDGFLQLSDLHLTYCHLKSLEDIIGLIYLPVLKYVYLEGNAIFETLPFEVVSDTIQKHGISIADPCFCSQFRIGTELQDPAASLRTAKLNEIKVFRKAARLFLHRDIRVSSRSLASNRAILEVGCKSRRSKPENNTTTAAVYSKGGSVYDPAHYDRTFLTGLHITESAKTGWEAQNGDIALPVDIQGTVRALRQALSSSCRPRQSGTGSSKDSLSDEMDRMNATLYEIKGRMEAIETDLD